MVAAETVVRPHVRSVITVVPKISVEKVLPLPPLPPLPPSPLSLSLPYSSPTHPHPLSHRSTPCCVGGAFDYGQVHQDRVTERTVVKEEYKEETQQMPLKVEQPTIQGKKTGEQLYGPEWKAHIQSMLESRYGRKAPAEAAKP